MPDAGSSIAPTNVFPPSTWCTESPRSIHVVVYSLVVSYLLHLILLRRPMSSRRPHDAQRVHALYMLSCILLWFHARRRLSASSPIATSKVFPPATWYAESPRSIHVVLYSRVVSCLSTSSSIATAKVFPPATWYAESPRSIHVVLYTLVVSCQTAALRLFFYCDVQCLPAGRQMRRGESWLYTCCFSLVDPCEACGSLLLLRRPTGSIHVGLVLWFHARLVALYVYCGVQHLSAGWNAGRPGCKVYM